MLANKDFHCLHFPFIESQIWTYIYRIRLGFKISEILFLFSWGGTDSNRGPSDTDVRVKQLAAVLQELAGLVVVSDEDCGAAIATQGGYSEADVTQDMLCAGGEQGKDGCQGDSGGPLVWESSQQYQVIGVVSWGIGCARAGLPGVYAEVASMCVWYQR